MIKYLYANNYKSFANFRIEFGQSNLLIGGNGTGKSNVLALIASLRDLIMGTLSVTNVFFSQSTITRWTKSNIQTFELGITSDQKEYVYKIEIVHDIAGSKRKISSEKLLCNGSLLYQTENGMAELFDDNSNKIQALVDETSSGLSIIPRGTVYSTINEFQEQINNIILCIPDPKIMMDIVQNDVFIPRIDFSNIASTYAGVVMLEPDIYNELVEAIRETDKSFVKAKVSIDPNMNSKRLMMDYQYNDVSCSYYFSELSDGEKMLFVLYTLLYGYIKRGKTILLDEPDNYLSLREIQPWCSNIERELGEKSQCIMISHHPEVIDYMADANGIWMKRISSGESIVMDKPCVANNDELFSYSEMISRGLLDEVE